MKFGTLRSRIVTQQDTQQTGVYKTLVEIPDAELPAFDRRSWLLKYAQDLFVNAAQTTGLPINEGLWFIDVEPLVQAIYGLPERIRN